MGAFVIIRIIYTQSQITYTRIKDTKNFFNHITAADKWHFWWARDGKSMWEWKSEVEIKMRSAAEPNNIIYCLAIAI